LEKANQEKQSQEDELKLTVENLNNEKQNLYKEIENCNLIIKQNQLMINQVLAEKEKKEHDQAVKVNLILKYFKKFSPLYLQNKIKQN
jgi:hypothetical protein